MYRKKEDVRTRYFEAIKTLHTILLFSDKVSLTEFAKKQHISGYFSNAILKSGVIVPSKGRASYKWVGPNPNMAMAERLRVSVRTLRANDTKKREAKKDELEKMMKSIKPTSVVKSNGISQKQIKKYEIKIGWIKATVTPVY